jgi:hypothetical protein
MTLLAQEKLTKSNSSGQLVKLYLVKKSKYNIQEEFQGGAK